ncbi:MAG: hypothetical protein OXE77_00085 [Flavobacteriaceae bacterium]|nr:hypothetical protein [Flavobacteriaceae bacterium]MCY4267008.1 hypothetical protein [Flavobacteriaceae bacterium]
MGKQDIKDVSIDFDLGDIVSQEVNQPTQKTEKRKPQKVPKTTELDRNLPTPKRVYSKASEDEVMVFFRLEPNVFERFSRLRVNYAIKHHDVENTKSGKSFLMFCIDQLATDDIYNALPQVYLSAVMRKGRRAGDKNTGEAKSIYPFKIARESLHRYISLIHHAYPHTFDVSISMFFSEFVERLKSQL